MNTVLLAYPDNPVSSTFIRTFDERGIKLRAVIVETKSAGKNWKRLKRKVKKDGLVTALRRFVQISFLRSTGRNAVQLAGKKAIEVYRVEKFNSRRCAGLIRDLDTDLLAIASAPILKEYVFTPAKRGCLNAHPGWLPKYRGIGANAYALLNVDLPGITIHFIDAGIDTGRIILREKIAIQPGDTVARINDRAVTRGAELMADVIRQIEDDALKLPKISETHGKCYRAMPYKEVKIVNKKLKSVEESHVI